MKVELFDFVLPEELVAQRPAEPREQARLLVVGEELLDHRVADLPRLLEPGDLLLLNDSRVLPTRFWGTRGAVAVEVTLVEPEGEASWWALARPGRASLAEEMIAALRRRGCPIEESDVIEGLPATGGIIVPKGPLRRSDLPKAVYFWHHGVLQLITTESPGKLDLERRVEMQLICFDVFMEALAAGRFVRPEAVTWDI